jgi:lipoprotein NlpD
LVIVKHDARFLSAYAYNQALLVREGQKVASGQVIAKVGTMTSGIAGLHFEIRKDGEPQDPLRFLPPQ